MQDAAREIKLLVGSATTEANNGKIASTEMIKRVWYFKWKYTKNKSYYYENISGSLKRARKE